MRRALGIQESTRWRTDIKPIITSAIKKEVCHGSTKQGYLIQGNLEEVLFKQRSEIYKEIYKSGKKEVEAMEQISSPRGERVGWGALPWWHSG